MVSDGEEDDDDSFVQVASKKATKGDGFDGFGTPDPFNQNDDDQVDQGEPNAPDTENPNEDANMVSDGEEDDDDSFVQVASKKATKGDGFDGFGTPDPFNQMTMTRLIRASQTRLTLRTLTKMPTWCPMVRRMMMTRLHR